MSGAGKKKDVHTEAETLYLIYFSENTEAGKNVNVLPCKSKCLWAGQRCFGEETTRSTMQRNSKGSDTMQHTEDYVAEPADVGSAG